MKKILVISGRASHQTFISEFNELIKNIEDTSKSSLFTAHYRDLVISIADNTLHVLDQKNDAELTSYDLVYLRNWHGAHAAQAITIAHFLAQHDIPFIDREPLHAVSKNKLTQNVFMNEHGLPVIDTIFAFDDTSALKAIEHHGFTWPLILKDVVGSHGNNNFLVDSSVSLKRIFSTHPTHQFLIQRFVPNDYDFRVLVLGNQAGTISKRTRQNKNDHRNNAYVGALEEEVDIADFPAAIAEDCVRAAGVFGRQVAGVDVVIDKITGAHYILEVNSAPGITYKGLSELPQLVRYLDQPAATPQT